ncbi:16S rRNA (uracil(1498)-N(3))-methyltransferase [Halarcobacter mediterraneus]|uniref:Ribosomal RNA small subunit methyltransferase E n=1 Tax=Halarcobacter mediterraneus TaxID=2023153 RepID=A0A4Q1AU62_9BACT|nr:16S rRNA (uracil(1498)-N(3))-methyltransferase [Halarcobacter mediterraneus]RXK13323.1 16S rRNA (uracil(1498)-N(3))-methyltransferase [Halarcobacter mediterraneus]
MQFTYHKEASQEILTVDNETYKYLFKARRQKINDEIYFRNLNDKNIYLYRVIDITKKDAKLQLLSFEEKIIENDKKIHLGWCLIDPKIVEKYIASLNELGVDKITFIYCEYSQNNFKINMDKLEKILINSSSQCGRSSIIKLESSNGIEDFLKQNDNVYFLDFSSKSIDSKKDEIKTLVLGCEGGFSKKERDYFEENKIVGFDSKLILRSETAAISAVSKIIV